MELLLGVITGIIFGFLLQKGQVLRFEKQVGFLRLQDFTIIKFMLTIPMTGTRLPRTSTRPWFESALA